MKKILKLTVITILILSMLLTSACSNPPANEDAKSDKIEFENGIHILTAPEVETEDYLIKDGKFQYTLVFPTASHKLNNAAKSEFLILLKRATGISSVDIISDEGFSEFDDQSKYISFGHTKLVDLAGLSNVYQGEEYEKLKDNGVRIITKGKSIFLMGGPVAGVLNAVYSFMTIYFNYDYFARNCIYIDTDVKTAKLRAFDITDVPDIDYHNILAGTWSTANDTITDLDRKAMGGENISDADIINELKNRRYRMHMMDNINAAFLIVKGGIGAIGDASSAQHNVTNIFSIKSDPDNVETKWLAESGNQICWTAHGDAESMQRMRDYCVKRFIDTLKENPAANSPFANTIMIGNEDGGGHCQCPACQEVTAREGTLVGESIRFANEISVRVHEWMRQEGNEAYLRPNLKIAVFAYGPFVNAPATYNADTGKYEFLPGCMPDKNVAIFVTSGGYMGINQYDEANDEFNEKNQIWGDCGIPNLYYWQYAQYYTDSPFYLDIQNSLSAERYKWLASMNTQYILTELEANNYGVTRWVNLACYISMKLTWDSSRNVEELTKKFMKEMYKGAADSMFELYMDMKVYYQMMMNEKKPDNSDKFVNSGYNKWDIKDYPYPILKRWMGMLDKAKKDIGIYKDSNPGLYEVLDDRIEQEALSILYMILKVHGSIVPSPLTVQEKEMYKERIMKIGKKYPNFDVSQFENI